MVGARYLLKRHPDILTVPETLKTIHLEYVALGYADVSAIGLTSFTYKLDDGTSIVVCYENGAFYEKVVPDSEK